MLLDENQAHRIKIEYYVSIYMEQFMKNVIRFVIKSALICFLLVLMSFVSLFKSKLGALPLTILYAGIGAAIYAIYKYKGKSPTESTEITLNKDR